jgi:hypothetical protein
MNFKALKSYFKNVLGISCNTAQPDASIADGASPIKKKRKKFLYKRFSKKEKRIFKQYIEQYRETEFMTYIALLLREEKGINVSSQTLAILDKKLISKKR